MGRLEESVYASHEPLRSGATSGIPVRTPSHAVPIALGYESSVDNGGSGDEFACTAESSGCQGAGQGEAVFWVELKAHCPNSGMSTRGGGGVRLVVWVSLC